MLKVIVKIDVQFISVFIGLNIQLKQFCFIYAYVYALHFLRAMHCSAKRGIEIACRPSVRLSVCDVRGSGPHRLGILETNCTNNSLNTFALRNPNAIYLLCGILGNFGETRGAVLGLKSNNISETRKDRGKVTVEGL